jgi:predicted molibdopterin-dependent oxidoreductase YjgC
VARLKPRFNAEVNRWWMCDAGRYGFEFVDDASRLDTPLRRQRGGQEPAGWDEALAAVTDVLASTAPDEIGVIASPRMANEDLFALRRLLGRLGIHRVGFAVPPAAPGDEDALLIRADKNPNTRGAELIGLDGDVVAILKAARDGRLRLLWVFAHDLLASVWPDAPVRAALTSVPTLIWSGTNANATSALAHWVLPAAAWVEREGTFTNFENRVQRFRTAVAPLGEARADWEVIGDVLQALGEPVSARRAEHWFRALTAAIPAFTGLTYQNLGEEGTLVRARAVPAQLVLGEVSEGAVAPPGRASDGAPSE